jgi:hypothetical protein
LVIHATSLNRLPGGATIVPTGTVGYLDGSAESISSTMSKPPDTFSANIVLKER